MPMIQGTSRFDWRRLFCLPPKRWHPPPQQPAARARTVHDAVRMKQRREDKMRRMSEDQLSMPPADSMAADLSDFQIREAVQAVVGERSRLSQQGSRGASSGEATPKAPSSLGKAKARKDSPPPADLPVGSTRAGDPLPAIPTKPLFRPVHRQGAMQPLGEVRSSEERDSGDSAGTFADWRGADRRSQDKARLTEENIKRSQERERSDTLRSSTDRGRTDILASRQSSGEASASSTGGTKHPPEGPRQLKRIQTTKPNTYAVLSENGALRNNIEKMRGQLVEMRKQVEAAETRAEKGKKARHFLMLYNNIISAIEATPSNQEKMAGFYQLVSIKHTMIDKARGRVQNREVVMPKETTIMDTWPTLSPFSAPTIQQPQAEVPKRAAEDPGPSRPVQAEQIGSKVPKTFELAPANLPGQPSEQKQRVAPIEYEVPALPDR